MTSPRSKQLVNDVVELAGKKIEGLKKRATEDRWLDGLSDSTDMNLGRFRDSGGQGDLEAQLQSMGVTKS